MSDNDRSLPPLPAVAAEGNVDSPLAASTVSDPQQQEAIRQPPLIEEGTPADRRCPLRDGAESTLSHWGALKLRRKIADGSFGTVYLAWDPALERDVALKVLRAADRFGTVIQEGRLLARVRHPNVVTVYGVDEYDGIVGLWM